MLFDLRSFSGWDTFEQALRRAEYDVAGIGYMGCDRVQAARAIALMKAVWPNRPVIAGGLDLSLTRPASMEGVDCLIYGEADYALADVLDQYELTGQLPRIVDAGYIKDIDSLPMEDRELFDDRYERAAPLLPGLDPPNMTMLWGRGCCYRCKFCAPSGVGTFGKVARFRSPELILDEILEQAFFRGVGSVMVHNDLVANARWLSEVVSGIGRYFSCLPTWCQMRADFICKNEELVKDWAKLGLTWISLGIESGSQRILDFLDKGECVDDIAKAAEILHANGVNVFGNYMMGVPTETSEDRRATIALVKRISPAWHSGNEYVSFEGSLLHDYAVENGLLTDELFSSYVFPFRRKLKGIDYGQLERDLAEARSFTRPINTSRHVACIGIPPRRARRIRATIIVRSHNRPAMVEAALKSLQAQSLKEWEAVVIDDHSSRETLDVLNRYAESDPRIRWVPFSRDAFNRSAALNQGLVNAQGEYICFCDDDCEQHPDYLRKMVDALDGDPSCSFAVCQSLVRPQAGNSYPTRGSIPRMEQQAESNCLDLGEVMTRRSALNRIGWFDERINHSEDGDFFLRMLRSGLRGVSVPLALFVYKQHPGQGIRSVTAAMDSHARHLRKAKVGDNKVSVEVLWPSISRLQWSQLRVGEGIRDTLGALEQATLSYAGEIGTSPPGNHPDFIIVCCPFMATAGELSALRARGIPMVSVHVEDPPALAKNLEMSTFFDWVCTNDVGCHNDYRLLAQSNGVPYSAEKIIVMPSQSVNSLRVPVPSRPVPHFDVCVCGYMYDSRKQFIQSIMDMVSNSWVFVGTKGRCERGLGEFRQGWDDLHLNAQILPMQSEADTMALYAQSKIILVMQRSATDLGGSRSATTATRGFAEAYSGSLVLSDSSRTLRPPFQKDEIAIFTSAGDFRNQLRYYLDHDSERLAMGRRAQERAAREFTYVSRVGKLINALRSPRYGVIIE